MMEWAVLASPPTWSTDFRARANVALKHARNPRKKGLMSNNGEWSCGRTKMADLG